ncbi:hypothetical protein N4P33_15590 [Streptomyces sp. 15-116A]|nr:hypothetical protein [Streptomyces sp. 15-116A]MCT7353585.1 hypothetical protein [Streptomyces sp. 15-116A]
MDGLSRSSREPVAGRRALTDLARRTGIAATLAQLPSGRGAP